ncbi:MAG: GNAT family N-acetyltransferase [Chloroflexota bacterium]
MHIGRRWRDDPRNLLLRPFDGSPDDHTSLARVRNATLRAISLPEDFTEVTAEDMRQFYGRPGYTLADNAWLFFLGDRPIAAAVLFPRSLFHDRQPGNFDLYVDPDYWRHGIGSRLLAHLEQAAVARGHRVLETTIALEDAQSNAFLVRHGFAVVGQLMHLTRHTMDNLPTPAVPEGYTLRSLADLNESSDLYMQTANRLGSYDSGYSLIRPEEMESIAGSPAWDPEGVLFAFDPTGRIVGLIRASVSAGGRGYLHEIRIEPASRGLGLGRAMLAASLQYLARRGALSGDLDTAGDNTAAHGLALKAGFIVTRHWLHYLRRLAVPTV